MTARGRLTTAALVLTLVVSIAACTDSYNAADDERVDTLMSYAILESAPPGAVRRDDVLVQRSRNGIAWETSGDGHRAATSWFVKGPIHDVSRFYGEALANQGWKDVRARCFAFEDRLENVVVTASRWEDGYEATAGVDVLADDTDTVQVGVGVSVPFHDESGDRPLGASPDLTCLDGE